jgi:hypothetical protein
MMRALTDQTTPGPWEQRLDRIGGGRVIPRTVLVNGVRYRTAVRPRAHFRCDGVDLDGLCDPEQALIVIARELAPSQQTAAYRHEIGHAAFHESGASELLKDYTTQPDRLEEVLLQVFAPVYRLALGVK